MPGQDAERQREVDAYFDPIAERWRELYDARSLEGVVHRERQALALAWVEELGLSPGARVLDLGCGAGLMTVELARRGLLVDAIDPSTAMVDLARSQAAEAGLDDRVTVARGDAHSLPFEPESFDLVVALGVLPFLHRPEQALREVARVLRRGGHALFTSDNALRLNQVLDPRFSPPFAALRARARTRVRRATGGRGLRTTIPPALAGAAHRYRVGEVQRMVAAAELTSVRVTTLGFGPFSFLGLALLSDAASVRVHAVLQSLATRGAPILRSTGLQHMVLARKEGRTASAPARRRTGGLRIEDVSVPVVVLKLYHHCGLGAVRTLGRLGVPVYGVHEDPSAPAARSRYLVDTLRWNIDEAPDDASVEQLLSYARRIGGRPVLIATDDRSADFIADNADTLREAFRFPDQPAGLARALADKRTLHELCLEHGVPTPNAAFPQRRAEVIAFLEGAVFPVVVKGIDAWQLQRRSGVRMAFAKDPDELLELYDRMEDPQNPNLMLQEYIPGGADSVWMLDGYFDSDLECRAAFTGQKLRQYPAYTGMTSLGVCRPNAEVERLTRTFMKRLGYQGILDLGFRYDARDGRYKLLDVNPRLGATFRLFAGTNGLDVVRALYLDLTGQPIPQSALIPERKWIVENYDLAASIAYRRDGALRARDWIVSLLGVREAAWLAADDPRPFAALARRSIGEYRRSGLRSARSR